VTGLSGTGALVRLALRRDRVLLPLWIVVFVVMAASSAAATVDLYPTVASRVAAAASLNGSQSLVALYGRIYDPTSVGAIGLWKMGGLGAVFIAVLAILIVVRHTRAEEEAGRLELVGATVIGRSAPLTAALLVVIGMNLVLALFTAAGLVAAGMPTDGSLAFGLAWAGVGMSFAAIAAVAAQLTRSARAATGIATAVLGFVYVLRAIGDTAGRTGPRWLTWLSPIGWGQQFRPYAGNRWWVLLITVGFTVVVVVVAYRLQGRRDLGAGLVPDRPGSATAASSLRTPLALAWRLQRGALLGWAVAFLLLGLVFGNIASHFGEFVSTPQSREFITKMGGEKGLVDSYLRICLSFIGLAASAYGVHAAMRLRSEETAQRAETVLATATGRVRWAWSYVAVAIAGATLLIVVGGTGAGIAHGTQVGDMGRAAGIFGGALAQVPAACVLTGIVVAAFGLAPRLVAAGWVALVAFVLLGELGPLFEFDQWVLDISPFTHVPKIPGAAFSATPLLALTAVAALLIAAGLAGFRRRDVG
jgi:polyether ionophore transport system permease protein